MNKIIFLRIAPAIFIFSLCACLKNAPGTVDFNTVKPVIEQLNSQNYLTTANNNGANTYPYFMQVRTDSTHLAMDSITVEIGGSPIGKDVSVTLGVDTADFNAFNALNSGKYAILPSSSYSWTNGNSVVIKAGQQATEIYLTFKTNLIDFSQSYILPIIITDASGEIISQNYGATMYTVIPGNQYSGLYHSAGSRVIQGAGITAPIDDSKYLYDISAFYVSQGSFPTSAKGPSALVPNAVVANCADQSVYSSIGEQMDLIVNPDNSVTVTNDTLYGFGKDTYLLHSGPSSYDPTKHVFTLSYGFVDPYSGDSSVVSEVMTRLD
jgi:Domain of unknown function (DUF1735)/Domain of unknown function (DUF4361)